MHKRWAITEKTRLYSLTWWGMYCLVRLLPNSQSSGGSGKRGDLQVDMLNETRNKACLFFYFFYASVHVSVKLYKINVRFSSVGVENVSPMQRMVR